MSGDLTLVSHSRASPRRQDFAAGVSLLNISDPDAPVLVSTLALPDGNDGVREVLLSGSLALVAARGSGLLIYDVSRPQKPGLAGRFRPDRMFRSGRWNAFAVSVSNGTVALKAGPFAFILEDER